MIWRLLRDESGVTMGLTVMMVVLIGVMGAGLLTFVQNDLGSVIESNQGQAAFNLADAGTQAAKRHLLVDANVFNYDGSNTTGTIPLGESRWSCKPDASNVCTGTGKSIDLGTGNLTTVWIQYLKPSLTPDHLDDPDRAPELVPATRSNYEYGRDFFRVISEGTAGNARRKVEAIYQTYDLGTPRAYFTKGDLKFVGASRIANISLFTMGSITGNATIVGPDLAYDDWYSPPFNATARTAAPVCSLPDGTATGKCAGAGALGTVDSRIFQANRDFDGNVPTPSPTNPKFIKKIPPDRLPQTTSEITFPFNYEREPDIEMMRQAAQMQNNGFGGDNYYTVGSSTNLSLQEAGLSSGPKWPATSDISTVVFVRFTDGLNTSNSLVWDVDAAGTGCNRPPVFGTLVVENGKFETQPNKAPLKGTIVVKGAGPGTDVYTDTGGGCMQAFVYASGDIKLAGNIDGFTLERGNRPGFYGVRLWSWRECYSTSCG